MWATRASLATILNKTLTIGKNDPDTTDKVVVDLVDPVWSKVNSQTTFDAALNGTSVITLKGYDKYLKLAGENATELKPEHIKVYVNNAESGITLTAEDIAVVASDATSIQYQLTIRGFTANDKQVRAEIQPGALKDN